MNTFKYGHEEDWKDVIDECVDQISDHVGEEIISNLQSDFSTTNAITLSVSQTSIMSAMKQYFVYKGNYDTKKEKLPKDYDTYAKIYIRADAREVKIKRKYQTFFEFWADTFSFWNALLAIVAFILNSFYKFYAFYYIGNEIFFFKEKENKEINHLNYSEKNKEIKRLMDITSLVILQQN